MEIFSHSLSHVGHVRKANEDNYGQAVTPNGNLFVVCDGMGGHVGGATASKIAVDSIIEFFNKSVYENQIVAISNAFQFANEQVYASALNNPELKGMGTTGVVLLVVGEECYIGHVGDSRIYLQVDGRLNRLTKDHSFVQTLVDGGYISDAEAESHPQKNQILKALGIQLTVEATVNKAPILPKTGDVFMLCTDGLNGMVNDKSMEMMLQNDDIQLSAQVLINAALDSGGLDNVTLTLVSILESNNKSSVFQDFNPIEQVINDNSGLDTNTTITIEKRKNEPEKKKIWILSFFLGLVLVGVLLFIFRDKISPSKTEKKVGLSIKNISSLPLENLFEYDRVKLIDFEGDTVIVSAENEEDTIRVVKGVMNFVLSEKSKIKYIEYKKEQQNKTKIKDIDSKKQSIKSLSDMTIDQIDKLEVNQEEVSEKNKVGIYQNKFKIKTNEFGLIISIKYLTEFEYDFKDNKTNLDTLFILNKINEKIDNKCDKLLKNDIKKYINFDWDKKEVTYSCFCEKQ